MNNTAHGIPAASPILVFDGCDFDDGEAEADAEDKAEDCGMRVLGDVDAQLELPEVDMERLALTVEGDEDGVESKESSRLDEVYGVAVTELKVGRGEGYSASLSAIEMLCRGWSHTGASFRNPVFCPSYILLTTRYRSALADNVAP